MMETDRVFTADYIKKRRRRHGRNEFLVKWKGFPSRMNTWEPKDNILDPGLILEFEERLAEEYRKGRPGRKPAKLLNLKDLKSQRRDFLAKCKQAMLLSEQPINQDQTTVSYEEESDCYKDGADSCNDMDIDSPDANGNFAHSDGMKIISSKAVKKPAFLQLNERHSPAGNCRDARSPIAGCLPSPTVPRPPNSATYDVGCDTPLSTTSPDSKPPSPSNVTTPTNTVKLGKFALLRKYRNSLEENTQISVTNVTIGGVTVAIAESTTPKGFFRKIEPDSVCW